MKIKFHIREHHSGFPNGDIDAWWLEDDGSVNRQIQCGMFYKTSDAFWHVDHVKQNFNNQYDAINYVVNECLEGFWKFQNKEIKPQIDETIIDFPD